MISRAELAEWAERFSVAPAQIARDHFMSHVLHALGSLHANVRFFGGTALCRTYLDGTRLSEDVDLLHTDPRDFLQNLVDELPTALRREFPDTTCTEIADGDDGQVTLLNKADSIVQDPWLQLLKTIASIQIESVAMCSMSP